MKLPRAASIIGIVLWWGAGAYAILQLTRVRSIEPSLEWTYVCLLTLPIGFFLFLWGIHENRLDKRREIDSAELESLYSEAARLSEKDKELADKVNLHVERLKEMESIKELDALPLRFILADLYPPEELKSKTEYEIWLLDDYTSESDPEQLDEIGRKFEKIRGRLEDIGGENSDRSGSKEKSHDEILKLRAMLKSLRETVAWYDHTWAKGELIQSNVSYWATVSIVTFILAGILPIVHSEGSLLLTVVHWMLLGVAGALLRTLVALRNQDTPEVGEQEGKQILAQTVISIAIGMITSLLLWSALNGKIISGIIFPTLPMSIDSDLYWKNTGLSIFWGILSGFSSGILLSLTGLAEGAFAKDNKG